MIKQFKNQELTTHEGVEGFRMDKLPIMSVFVDGKKCDFILDTGAQMSLITDSTIIKNLADIPKATIGKATGPNGLKISKQTMAYNFKNNIFESQNKVFLLNHIEPTECNTMQYAGIIGFDALSWNTDNMWILKYSDETLSYTKLSSAELEQLGYKPIPALISDSDIKIQLDVNGKREYFKFDTGFYGGIAINQDTSISLGEFDNICYEGILRKSIGGTINEIDNYYLEVPTSLGDVSFNATVLKTQKLNKNLVGNKFLKHYDWVFDLQNKQVYFKAIQAKGENTIDKKTDHDNIETAIPVIFNVENNELYISARSCNNTKFILNKPIKSIDNYQIEHNRICEVRDSLNNLPNKDKQSLLVIYK